MKNYTFIAIILGIMFIFSATSAAAQKFEKILVEIPFEFSVGEKSFEAGKYIFTPVSSNGSLKIFHLKHYDKNTQAFISTIESGKIYQLKKNKTAIKFNRYGENYFLSRISNTAEGTDAILLKTKKEN